MSPKNNNVVLRQPKTSLSPRLMTPSRKQFRSSSLPTSKRSSSPLYQNIDGESSVPSFEMPMPEPLEFVSHSRSSSLPSGKEAITLSKPRAQSSEGPESCGQTAEIRNASPPRRLTRVTLSDFLSIRASQSDASSRLSEDFGNSSYRSGPENSPAGPAKHSHVTFLKSSGLVQEEQQVSPPAPPSGAGSPRLPVHATHVRTSSGSISRSGRRDERSPRDEPNTRVVYINNSERTNEGFSMAGNRVRTSKYTLLSFVPRNLFEQFHRFAYIYFLVIVILNQIPQLAVFGRTASLFPLVFVLVVTAAKDAYEDWGRHHADTVENNRLSLVLQDGHYKPKKWKRIRVGEMVKIHANETVPCDMVLLGTSDPTGVAYLETMNLDGESNLKSRYAKQETASKRPEIGPVTGTLICEYPNRNIYDFTAYVDMGGVHLPLGPNNIVLRGCEVKNTSWIVGVVVYAGSETKAMLNSSGTQSKRSRLEQQMNRETVWLGFFLIVLCCVGGLGNGLWVARHESRLDIIPFYRRKNTDGDDYQFYGKVGEGIFAFLSCIIVFQVMVPISLYISMELVRLGQSYFMSRDIGMYSEQNDTRLQCRALNVNEDLGQIQYLFSDKTGTLTENRMEFHTASVDGVDYSDPKVAVDTAGKLDGRPEEAPVVQDVIGRRSWKPKEGARVDPNLVRLLQSNSVERGIVHDYMLVLAACNTVVPTKVCLTSTGQLEMQAASSEEASGLVEYQGESPDEQALVSAAASYGYTLLERTSSYIVIDVLGDVQRFQVLGIHEFDSMRKRMSVVVRCPDGVVKVLVKGADNAVLDVVGGESILKEKRQAEIQLATLGHLDRYAREGLRTLVIASRTLDAKYTDKWLSQFDKASTAMSERAGLLRAAAELVEKNLMLLGATGIEDKLQEGVPETIALLREAGIKVWVLTGDKQETAISIGFSCLLLTRDMQQIVINETTKEGCKEALVNAKNTFRMVPVRKSLMTRQKTVDSIAVSDRDPSSPMGLQIFVKNESSDIADNSHQDGTMRNKAGQPLALIIDGNSLVHCLTDELEQELFEVASGCKVVICCRVAPLQKAGIVSLVKRKAKEMTLAVGDGANDVSMIQMADVGVGISGQEGRQAVMASDFALGQFRFLQRLLLVHGHWNYMRLGYMVLYNFYRNAVFVMMLFWYILYAAFTPQTALTDWNLVFYSLIYTSLPTIIVGVLDKDVSSKTLLTYPALYSAGQRNAYYNQSLFWAFMLDTLWQSLVLFYVPYWTYRISDIDIWGIGTIWTIAVVVLVNLHLAMDTHHWTWINHLVFGVSIFATFICVLVMDTVNITALLQHHWDFYHMVQQARFWWDLFLILVLALLPRFIVKAAWERFFPSDIQIARESEVKGFGGSRAEQMLELNEVPH